MFHLLRVKLSSSIQVQQKQVWQHCPINSFSAAKAGVAEQSAAGAVIVSALWRQGGKSHLRSLN
jgi:hypothetical protein